MNGLEITRSELLSRLTEWERSEIDRLELRARVHRGIGERLEVSVEAGTVYFERQLKNQLRYFFRPAALEHREPVYEVI